MIGRRAPRTAIVVHFGPDLMIATIALLPWFLGQAPIYPDHDRLLVVRDLAGRERPVSNAADWEERRKHVLDHVQAVMGLLPGKEKRVPLDVQVVETADEATYRRIKLTYASEPGDRVPAWLLLPKDLKPGEKRPAMLCLHQTVAIGKDEPIGRGQKPDLHYAHELAQRGYVCLAPDYPRFGEHSTDPYTLGYASASMKAIWDNIRGVDLLLARDEVFPDRIGVIGHSLGGHNSIFTGVFEQRIKVVVSSCGFTSFPKYMKGNLTGWSHDGYMPRIRTRYGRDPKQMPFDFPELIAALAPRAFFTCSPIRDDNFDVGGVVDCLAAAQPVYALLGAADRLSGAYPDAPHTFPAETREEAYRFIDRVIGRSRGGAASPGAAPSLPARPG